MLPSAADRRRLQLPASGWRPRFYQRPLWDYLENGGRNAVAVWHRRSGKDEIALHRSAVAAHERVGNYWHCLPQYEHARKALWDAINPNTGRKRIDEAFPQELRSGTDESRMKITFKVGSIWQLVGSDNVDSLVGAPPVGITYSEWALSDPRSHGLLRPILAENNGWALFIYTARGYNHGFKTYSAAMKDPRSFGQLLTVDDTDIFSAETLEYERQQYIEEFGEEAGDALFRQEFYCDFSAANLGAILGRGLETAQREGRIDLSAAEYDPSGPGIIVSSDIGYRDAAAFWAWQPHVDGVALTNYDEDTGLDADDWIDRLREGFPPIDTLWLPHDAKAKTFRSKRSVVEVFLSAKPAIARIIDVTPDARIKDRINAARRVLKVSRFAPGTTKGVNALRSWSFKYDEKSHTLSSEPEHNWASHGADAYSYGAQVVPVRVTRKHTQVMEALQEQALARIKLDDFEFRRPNRMRL